MQRLHELDRLCHASFAPVSVDHPDIVKVEGVSALRDVSQHLRGSLMPTNGLFVLQHTGPQTFTSFPDILNWTLAAFKAIDDIRYFTGDP